MQARPFLLALIAVALLVVIGLLSPSIAPPRAEVSFTPAAVVLMPAVFRSDQTPPPTPASTPVPPTDTTITPTATNTTTPTPTGTKLPPTLTVPNVWIMDIEYDPPEGDVEGEYVLLENVSNEIKHMAGWTLRDEAGHVYTFPAFSLARDEQARVWTKTGTDTATDLYWGSSTAIWNNEGDTAYLRDQYGRTVHVYAY